MLQHSLYLSVRFELVFKLCILPRSHFNSSCEVQLSGLVVFVRQRSLSSKFNFVICVYNQLSFRSFNYCLPIFHLHRLLFFITVFAAVTLTISVNDYGSRHRFRFICFLKRPSIVFIVQSFIDGFMLDHSRTFVSDIALVEVLLFEIVVFFEFDHHRAPYHHFKLLIHFGQ